MSEKTEIRSQESGVRIERRTVLAQIAALALAGPLEVASAQHVHESVAADTKATGVYKPKALTAHEFDTLRALCELIVPGATKGGAADFIEAGVAHVRDALRPSGQPVGQGTEIDDLAAAAAVGQPSLENRPGIVRRVADREDEGCLVIRCGKPAEIRQNAGKVACAVPRHAREHGARPIR